MLVVGVNPVEVKRFSNPKLVIKPLDGVSMVTPSTPDKVFLASDKETNDGNL